MATDSGSDEDDKHSETNGDAPPDPEGVIADLDAEGTYDAQGPRITNGDTGYRQNE